MASTPTPRRIRALVHETTALTHVRQGVPRPPPESGDNGGPPGQLCIEVDGQRFRVRTARFSTQGLPDTPSHRHLTVVWFRWLVDEDHTPWCTVQA